MGKIFNNKIDVDKNNDNNLDECIRILWEIIIFYREIN